MINRRHFLAGLSSLPLAACAGLGWSGHRPPKEFVLTLASQPVARSTSGGGLGLSYESSLLSDASWFSASDDALVRLFRNLGSGVLRLGGNSSEFGCWQRTRSTVAAPFRYAITPDDIDRLRAFLDACDWRLVYGLNLGHGDAERAADEASYVAERIGQRLDALQIGNEPDLYDRNALRSTDYSAQAFVAEWKRYAAAIRRRARDVPLAGPDIAYKSDWLDVFARSCAAEVKFLSDHYYAVGPAKDPAVDIAMLWESQRKRYPRLREAVQRAGAASRALRVTEGNSCWDGGKPGLSDTQASALWALVTGSDFFRDGGDSFYFHGGPQAVYSPLQGTPAQGYRAQPLYYAMLMLARRAGGRMLDARLNIEPSPLDSYCVQTDAQHLNVLLVNGMQAGALDLRVTAEQALRSGTALRLFAPTLFNSDGVTLGGAGVQSDGRWTPQPETVAIDKGSAFVTIAGSSALLLQFEL